MEKLALSAAEKIAAQMHFDKDRKEVIAYGLTAIFQMAAIVAIISAFGLPLNFWLECMTIFLTVGIIRKSTGGAHSHSIYGCLIISCGSIVAFSALSRYVLNVNMLAWINVLITVLIIAAAALLFYKKVPVDSPNKPITKPEKIKRLRVQSYILLAVIAALAVLMIYLSKYNLRLLSVAMSLRFALLWQMFTLTKPGAALINSLDAVFGKISKAA